MQIVIDIMLLFFVLNIFHFVVGSNMRLVDDETYNRLQPRLSMRRKLLLIRTRVLWHVCMICSKITCFLLKKNLTSQQEKLRHCFSLKSKEEKLFSHESEEWVRLLIFFIKPTKVKERILMSYVGIVRNKLQTFLNEYPEHCRKNPIFRNKPPLKLTLMKLHKIHIKEINTQ